MRETADIIGALVTAHVHATTKVGTSADAAGKGRKDRSVERKGNGSVGYIRGRSIKSRRRRVQEASAACTGGFLTDFKWVDPALEIY